jgi:hypothetical protein
MQRLIVVVVSIVAMCFAASFVQAEMKNQAKLICITSEDLAGERTVNQCLEQGERFAIIDQYGIVRILSSEEVDLTRKINPGVLETRAFGIKGIASAPSLGEYQW